MSNTCAICGIECEEHDQMSSTSTGEGGHMLKRRTAPEKAPAPEFLKGSRIPVSDVRPITPAPAPVDCEHLQVALRKAYGGQCVEPGCREPAPKPFCGRHRGPAHDLVERMRLEAVTRPIPPRTRPEPPAPAPVGELVEALRVVLDETVLQAHVRGCDFRMDDAPEKFNRAVAWHKAHPKDCPGCVAEALLAKHRKGEK